jgi:hypothetical protein
MGEFGAPKEVRVKSRFQNRKNAIPALWEWQKVINIKKFREKYKLILKFNKNTIFRNKFKRELSWLPVTPIIQKGGFSKRIRSREGMLLVEHFWAGHENRV